MGPNACSCIKLIRLSAHESHCVKQWECDREQDEKDDAAQHKDGDGLSESLQALQFIRCHDARKTRGMAQHQWQMA